MPLTPWVRTRLLPLVAAPLMGVLGVVEAGGDAEFRHYFTELVVVAGWLAGAFLVQAFLPSVGAPSTAVTGLIAVMLAMGYVGYAVPARRSLVAVTASVAVFVGTDLVLHGFAWDSVFFPAVFYPARWAGRLVRRERERSAQLIEMAAMLDASREAFVLAAAQEERTRIAREVHDAVAHSVSVMTLQIGGLRRQLEPVLEDRPAERDVLLGLERLGRETVDELRGLVGILRRPGHEDSPTAPAPSLARVQDVVDDVRAAGLDVRLTVHGEPRELPRALDISAYRIVQEALTNVLRHAAGSSARVEVAYGHDAVDITVRDDGPRTGDVLVLQPAGAPATGRRVNGTGVGGHGLVGMKERTQMFGGSFRAGPHGAGFEVHAHLPTNRSSL